MKKQNKKSCNTCIYGYYCFGRYELAYDYCENYVEEKKEKEDERKKELR